LDSNIKKDGSKHVNVKFSAHHAYGFLE